MSRILMPTPADPDPAAASTPSDALLDLEGQAVLDFLRGEYASAARSSTVAIQPGSAPSQPEQVEPQDKDAEPTRHDGLVYYRPSRTLTPSSSMTPRLVSSAVWSACSAPPTAPRPTPATAGTTSTTSCRPRPSSPRRRSPQVPGTGCVKRGIPQPVPGPQKPAPEAAEG